jgi:hypothetical protein
VSGGDQLLDGGSTDESGGASDENTHELVSKFSLETNLGSKIILVK